MKIAVFYHHIAEAASQTGLPIEEIAEYVHSLGIDYAEVDMGDLLHSDKAWEVIKNAGMKISSIYGFYDFGGGQKAEDGFLQIDRSAEVGCEKIMIIPGFYSDNGNKENERSLMLSAMDKMCAYAYSKGITATIEDFDDVKSPIATSEQMLWFAERIPSLKITFDTGNFMYSGENELSAFDALNGRIVHVHCKDRSLVEKDGCEMKMTVDGKKMYPAAVGEGCIAMEEIVSRLESSGYKGIYAIEHFGAENQLDYIKKSAEWLKGRIK